MNEQDKPDNIKTAKCNYCHDEVILGEDGSYVCELCGYEYDIDFASFFSKIGKQGGGAKK